MATRQETRDGLGDGVVVCDPSRTEPFGGETATETVEAVMVVNGVS